MSPDQIAQMKRQVAVDAERSWWVKRLTALAESYRQQHADKLTIQFSREVAAKLEAVIVERER